jgi:hypothetical protein
MTVKINAKDKDAADDDGQSVPYRPDPVRPLSRQVDNPEVLRTYGAASSEGGAR